MASGVSGVDSLNPLNLSTSSGGGTASAKGGNVYSLGASSGGGKLGIIKLLVLVAGIAIVTKIIKKRG